MANAYMEIKVADACSAGWVNALLRRCTDLFRLDAVDEHDKSCSVFKVSGEGAHAFLVSEIEESSASRPPSVSVSVLEEVGDNVVQLDPTSIEVTWFRNPAAVDSALIHHTDGCARLVHVASGMVAQCTNYRSRAANHAEALSLLR